MNFLLVAVLLLPLASAATPASHAALKRAEADAAIALGQWDEDARHLKRAKEELDTSIKAFEQYRKAQSAMRIRRIAGRRSNCQLSRHAQAGLHYRSQ